MEKTRNSTPIYYSTIKYAPNLTLDHHCSLMHIFYRGVKGLNVFRNVNRLSATGTRSRNGAQHCNSNRPVPIAARRQALVTGTGGRDGLGLRVLSLSSWLPKGLLCGPRLSRIQTYDFSMPFRHCSALAIRNSRRVLLGTY